MSSLRAMRRLAACIRAIWRFTTSSFPASVSRLFGSGAAAVTPKRAPTETSSASPREMSISESGTERLRSHFGTVCRTTLSLIASSSCERPFAFLKVLMFSLSLGVPFSRRTDRCGKFGVRQAVAASNAY